MPVLVNFKICDNSRDCNGIKVCPVNAFYFDEKKKSISIDNSKCISCGKCKISCPVGAIHVAKTETDYKKIKKEIDSDPRKISDLFIDRYGAEPVESAFITEANKFDIQILQSTKPAIVEFFNNDSIHCLLHSIPIKNIFHGKDIVYRKINVDDYLKKKYKISKLPALVFFKDGKMMGKIEGYFEVHLEDELKGRINKIMKGK